MLMKFKSIVRIITSLIVLSFVLSACGQQPVQVRLKEVTKKTIEAFAYANAIVESENFDIVTLERGTRIDTVFVKEGDVVTEGRRLIKYGDRIKTSNIDGIVTRVNARNGSVVDFNDPVIVVLDTSSLVVKADVRQSDIPNVILGQSVTITGDAIRDNKVNGKVERISEVAKKIGDQSFVEVIVRIDGKVPDSLKAGMDVRCEISLAKKENALVITYDVVKEVGSDKFVFVFNPNNGSLEERKIVLGARSGINAEVKEGLAEGEFVVLDPRVDFKTGMPAEYIEVLK